MECKGPERETGFYWISCKIEEPTIVYYYFNQDYQVNSDEPGQWGFGFNIADGGGFIPDWEITDDSELIGPIEFKADNPPPGGEKEGR